MKTISAAFVLALMMVSSLPAETIELKSGKSFRGRVVEQPGDRVVLDVGDGITVTFFQDEIAGIHSDAQPRPEERHFLWEVKSDRTKVYLFGSIHLGKEDMYPLAGEVDGAFAGAGTLVVEVDTESIDPMEAQRTVAQKGLLPADQLLESQLDPKTFDKLQARFQKFGMPMDPMLRFKPWFIAVNLQVLQIKYLGYDEEYGVDRYFLRRAHGAGKKVLQLETLEQQLDFLDRLPDQNMFLDYTLNSLDETEAMLEMILAAWQYGDAAAMEKLTIADMLQQFPETRPIFEIILFNRNKDMAAEIKRYLGTDEVYFVVVGAAHLVGDQGLVELLRQEGFQVDQL
ncbi:MAG: TraB/GumN family protein [Candidatus Omnitrophota bacterium]|nr:TraB/GumN family protein [Candidatus Omnitrophota bacterium]MDZ4242804.1 TraB/GumN family protein [Candidatus Omnitrophota bacterium]